MSSIMNFNSKLVSSSLSFIDDSSNMPFKIETVDKYGTLQFETIEYDMDMKPANITIIFTIDSSASMSDMSRDGRTKMDHSLFTMSRIIESLCDSNISAIVAVNHFNDEVHRVLDFTMLSSDNKDNIIYDIQAIQPYGGTNMDAALTDMNERINAEMLMGKSSKYIQMFMTDGEANGGRVDSGVLSGLVPSGVSNIFIGYGMNHDARMLSTLSDAQHNGEYRFIDKIENSGLVYGEIIHNILYNLLDKPSITVENGTIYNWKTNEWVQRLNLSNISTNAKRDFHVKAHTSKMKQVVVKLWAKEDEENVCVGKIIAQDNNDDDMNLTRFAYKLRTQELLYEARKIISRTRVTPSLLFDSNDNKDKNDYIKTKLSAFMLRLNKYIANNDLNNDNMMKLLQDDIYVCYNSINMPCSNMYTIARQTSQGNQRAYSTSTSIDLGHCDLGHCVKPTSTGMNLGNCGKPTLTRQVAGGYVIAGGYVKPDINMMHLPHTQLKRSVSVTPMSIHKSPSNESITSDEDEIEGDPFKDYNLIQQHIVKMMDTGNKDLNNLMRQMSG